MMSPSVAVYFTCKWEYTYMHLCIQLVGTLWLCIALYIVYNSFNIVLIAVTEEGSKKVSNSEYIKSQKQQVIWSLENYRMPHHKQYSLYYELQMCMWLILLGLFETCEVSMVR